MRKRRLGWRLRPRRTLCSPGEGATRRLRSGAWRRESGGRRLLQQSGGLKSLRRGRITLRRPLLLLLLLLLLSPHLQRRTRGRNSASPPLHELSMLLQAPAPIFLRPKVGMQQPMKTPKGRRHPSRT